jgi:hypothetical protein
MTNRLIREIDEAQKGRARLYWLIYDELRRELGAERAETLLARAITRRGEEAGEALFGKLSNPSPRDVADTFLAVSPAEGAIFPHRREAATDGTVTIRVTRCPLQECWRDSGLGDDDLRTMCRIAGHFDRGCFGRVRIPFRADTWTPGHTGCCTITLGPGAAR